MSLVFQKRVKRVAWQDAGQRRCNLLLEYPKLIVCNQTLDSSYAGGFAAVSYMTVKRASTYSLTQSWNFHAGSK